MKRVVVVTMLALAAGGLSGAAEAQDTTAKKVQEPAKPPRRSRNLITRQEIEESAKGATNAEDIIRQLRPNFLRVPGGMTPGGASSGPKVYVDNTPLGGTEVLRGIQAAFIGEIAYLDPSEATTRYGTGHQSGAILISSLTAPKR